jgi:hypothetical protein
MAVALSCLSPYPVKMQRNPACSASGLDPRKVQPSRNTGACFPGKTALFRRRRRGPQQASVCRFRFGGAGDMSGRNPTLR